MLLESVLDMPLKVQIVTAEREVFADEAVDMVVAPGAEYATSVPSTPYIVPHEPVEQVAPLVSGIGRKTTFVLRPFSS